MWDSLPWFVQIAIEVGAVLFLYTVAVEAFSRTLMIILLLKGATPNQLEQRIKGEPRG
jgi:hypothetical protein